MTSAKEDKEVLMTMPYCLETTGALQWRDSNSFNRIPPGIRIRSL